MPPSRRGRPSRDLTRALQPHSLEPRRSPRWLAALLLCILPFAAGPRPVSAAPADAAQAEGVVVYSDSEWGLAFIHDGRQLLALETLGRAVPARGQRVRVRGTRATLRGHAAIVVESWTGLGPERAPQPQAPMDAAPAWITLEGFVRNSRGEVGRTFLNVTHGAQVLDVHLPAPLPAGASVPAIGSRVRLTGVLESPHDPWQARRLWVAGWDAAVLTVPAPDWSELPLRTLAEIVTRWRRGGVDGEIRVRARAVGRGSLQAFELDDGTGRVAAEITPPETIVQGESYEIRGFVGERRGRMVLIDARWRDAPEEPAASAASAATGPLLATVADVRALTREQAQNGLPVRLRAVVTYYEPAMISLFVQDGSGGVYVNPGHEDLGLRPGDLVQVEGRTAPGQLAPIVVSPRFTSLGTAELPAPRVTTAASLVTALDDCRRVETRGIVRSVHRQRSQIQISLAADGRRMLVVVPDARARSMSPACWTHACECAPSVAPSSTGGASCRASSSRSHGSRTSRSSSRLAASPSSGRSRPVRDVLRGGDQERWGRLARVSGMVLLQRTDQPLYLRDATGTLVVHVSGRQPVSPGDRVEVVGFPAVGRFAPRLEDAIAAPGRPR